MFQFSLRNRTERYFYINYFSYTELRSETRISCIMSSFATNEEQKNKELIRRHVYVWFYPSPGRHRYWSINRHYPITCLKCISEINIRNEHSTFWKPTLSFLRCVTQMTGIWVLAQWINERIPLIQLVITKSDMLFVINALFVACQ